MVAVKPRLILQSNWHDRLLRQRGTVWISFKRPGEPVVDGELYVSKQRYSGAINVSASEGFRAIFSHPGQLEAAFDEVTCKFNPPIECFTTHGIQRNICALDVQMYGGLGMSADQTGTVRVWGKENGELRQCLAGHRSVVETCRFFPSEAVCVTGSMDTTVKIWSPTSGVNAATMRGHSAGVTSLDFADSGSNMVSTSRDGCAKLWDVNTQRCLISFRPNSGPVYDCSVFRADVRLVDLGEDRSVAHERGTQSKLLALATEGRKVVGYGLQTREEIFNIDTSAAVNCVTFLSDVSLICGCQNSEMYAVDLRMTSRPYAHVKESRGAFISLFPECPGIIATTTDGSAFVFNRRLATYSEMTGPNCDPVYRAVTDVDHAYTCCKDGLVRKYRRIRQPATDVPCDRRCDPGRHPWGE